MLKRRGQSILEYVVILIAIVAVVAWAAKTIINPAVGKGLDNAQKAVESSADKLAE